jgi:REP element-mobilizing transposase RayT
VGPFDALPSLGSHSSTVLLAHLVWATRQRAPLLDPSMDAWLAALLERKPRRVDARVLAAANAADHVHVLLQYSPRTPVAQIALQLKGASSRALNRCAPHPARALWQVGYWCLGRIGNSQRPRTARWLRTPTTCPSPRPRGSRDLGAGPTVTRQARILMRACTDSSVPRLFSSASSATGKPGASMWLPASPRLQVLSWTALEPTLCRPARAPPCGTPSAT